MKRLALTAPLIAATLFLATGLRGEDAKATPAPAPGAMKGKRNAELLQRFDLNKDGRLDDDERAAAKEANLKEQMDRQATRAKAAAGAEPERARMLERFDLNKDGRLDDEERAAAEKARRERGPAGAAAGGNMRAEIVRRLDKNQDGKLDDAERTEAVGYISANLDEFPGLKQRFDQNTDGKLDDAERTALESGLKQFAQAAPGAAAKGAKSTPQAPREQAMKRFDKNADGKLDETERAAMQAEKGSRRPDRKGKAGVTPAPAPAKTDEPPVVDKEEEARVKKLMEEFAPKS